MKNRFEQLALFLVREHQAIMAQAKRFHPNSEHHQSWHRLAERQTLLDVLHALETWEFITDFDLVKGTVESDPDFDAMRQPYILEFVPTGPVRQS